MLFGDGAAAVVLQPAPPGDGILQIAWRTDGTLADLIAMPGGGCRYPPNSHESIEQRLPFIKMRGNETFKVAVRALTELSQTVLDEAGIGIDDIDLFIPHQANQRIIQAVGQRLGLRDDQVFSNVDRVGNTSAASIPLAMVDARDQGRLQPRRPGADLVVRRRPDLGIGPVPVLRDGGMADRRAVPGPGVARRSGMGRDLADRWPRGARGLRRGRSGARRFRCRRSAGRDRRRRSG